MMELIITFGVYDWYILAKSCHSRFFMYIINAVCKHSSHLELQIEVSEVS
jgi:hypothetical protein